MEKRELRRYIRSMKSMLKESEKVSASKKAFDCLEQCNLFINADKILLYHSLPDELSTLEFLQKWCTRKQLYLPRVNGEYLDILRYEPEKLELGAYQIEEPIGEELIDVKEIELMIIPAMAYDRKGNRLGRGKGYYDRLLSTSNAPKIGIVYDFQILESIPAEPHDIPVDMVISPSECYIINNS